MVELQNEATKLERLFEHNIVAKRAAFQVQYYLFSPGPPAPRPPGPFSHSLVRPRSLLFLLAKRSDSSC